jgi:transposase
MKKHSFIEILHDFRSEESILQKIFDLKYGLDMCPKGCGMIKEKYKPVHTRKCFQCTKCRKQIYPLKGTIFENTKIQLTKWCMAISEVAKSKNGVSASEISHMIGGSYKTAWNMLRKIRAVLMDSSCPKLNKIVEIDECYVGGKRSVKPKHDQEEIDKKNEEKKGRKRKYAKCKAKEDGLGIGNKMIVFGMAQRKGNIKMYYVEKKDKKTLIPLVKKHVEVGTTIMGDGNKTYTSLTKLGYKLHVMEAKSQENARRGLHTNNIEGAWSGLQNNIQGTHRHVSKKHLQSYLDEYTFRYNTRNDSLGNRFHMIFHRTCNVTWLPQE